VQLLAELVLVEYVRNPPAWHSMHGD
jgi:hypothetical protein